MHNTSMIIDHLPKQGVKKEMFVKCYEEQNCFQGVKRPFQLCKDRLFQVLVQSGILGVQCWRKVISNPDLTDFNDSF